MTAVLARAHLGLVTNAIILWDIDHTLLTIEGVSIDLYTAAFREVTGCG